MFSIELSIFLTMDLGPLVNVSQIHAIVSLIETEATNICIRAIRRMHGVTTRNE